MKVKSLIAGSVLAASAVTSSVAMAEHEFTGNLGLTSNYIWRGVTQTGDQAAIQGGIDYGYQGFYAGAWASNVTWTTPEGYEIDLYAGYGFDWGQTSWDIGYIQYMYPVGDEENDFGEAYLNFGWNWLSAGVAYTVSKEVTTDYENDIYLYVAGEWQVGKSVALGALYGDYDFDDPATTDYAHYQVYLTAHDFTFALDQNDLDETVPGDGTDDMRFTVSYSKSFDFLK
jgi:uncharacterized protein (TIGR02001 family)